MPLKAWSPVICLRNNTETGLVTAMKPKPHWICIFPLQSKPKKKSYLDFSHILFSKNSKQALFGDVILNIIIFIPIGFLLHAVLRRHCESSLKTAAFVFIIGTLFTFGIESLQYFSLTRYSSLVDMINNMVGTTVGIAIDIFYIGYLKSQRRSLQI